jgi:hypothetical protein
VGAREFDFSCVTAQILVVNIAKSCCNFITALSYCRCGTLRGLDRHLLLCLHLHPEV